MTSERAVAYTVAMKSLKDLQVSKFSDLQMNLFRETADELILLGDMNDRGVELLTDSSAELQKMADAGRIMAETADRITRELGAIGPLPEPALV